MVNAGDILNGKEVYEVVQLSNGWELVRTENSKTTEDFRVKIVNSQHPRGVTIKHAHFAIDYFGKLCYGKDCAQKLLDALVKTWHREDVEKIVEEYESQLGDLPGYELDYILYAMNWILDQEDINFTGRPPKKQKELNEMLGKQGISTPEGRKGSELAISLFCDILDGTHPVEAFYRTGLRI